MLTYNENGIIQVIDHEALERKLNWGREFHFTELNNEQMELVGRICKLFHEMSERLIVQKLKLVYWTQYQPHDEYFTRLLWAIWFKKLNNSCLTFEECLKN